jgi:hypothetical protein
MFVKSRKSYFFMLENTNQRSAFYQSVDRQRNHAKPETWSFFASLRYVCGSLTQTLSPSDLFQRSEVMQEWRKRRISNCEYLLYANILSGRSFNDLSQYPVFPWVIRDYECARLDLSDERVYRNLSVPIAAHNEQRLAADRHLMDEVVGENERCLYRFHYSSAGSVVGFQMRLEPFTSLHIAFQGGRFDHPDRLFKSIGRTWYLVNSMHKDYRELIPEFFYLPQFLENLNDFDLGVCQSGQGCDTVSLPPWASNPFEFVQIHRQALESKFVRMHLND